ncbi:hypothetical protein [Paraurantiacibacter namhicola]|uniref:Cytochrome b562 n=1 Tax=Paraurantiacibacter namhicola TaxID=645517 RepID=A0A1C7D950_9SPHN|nr:hypothetical protein [Paraurantiacibacter namhicola]ANU08010.1 hypothetical protein A6F65_01713 [Paraurantiacibacter namhicola]
MFKKITTALVAGAMFAGTAMPVHAQQADMSEDEIYGLLMDCTSVEFLLMKANEGKPEAATHEARSGTFVRAAKGFGGKDNDTMVSDMGKSTEKIMGYARSDDDTQLGELLGKCERIYPVVEEHFGTK